MRRAALFVAGLFVALAAPAYAQQAPGERIPAPQPLEGLNPTTQAPPQKQLPLNPWTPGGQPTGVQAGPVTFFPSVTAGAFYDDNVFATTTSRMGSWAGFVRPELAWRGQGDNSAYEGSAFLEGRSYARFSSEDQVNGGIRGSGTVMPDNDTQLIGRFRYLHAHEDRGGGESLLTNFDKPVGYDLFEAGGAFNKRFNRFWTSLGVAGSVQHYETPTVTGIPVDQSYRDGNVGVVSARFGYVVAPLTSVFAEVAGNRRDFQVDTFDSSGYRIVGGVLLEPGQGARVKGEAYIGYMNQDYNGPTFQTVSTITYGGSLAFLLAPRWTAVVEGRRQALESALNPFGAPNGGSSVVESLIGARLDYAVLPNLVIGAGATYLVDEFKGAGRTDYTLSPLVSVKYFVNPFVTVGFDYRYANFDSSGFAVGDYYRNVYLFSINARI
jgi:hypothetical protein